MGRGEPNAGTWGEEEGPRPAAAGRNCKTAGKPGGGKRPPNDAAGRTPADRTIARGKGRGGGRKEGRKRLPKSWRKRRADVNNREIGELREWFK
jgi:hypothetical protein